MVKELIVALFQLAYSPSGEKQHDSVIYISSMSQTSFLHCCNASRTKDQVHLTGNKMLLNVRLVTCHLHLKSVNRGWNTETEWEDWKLEQKQELGSTVHSHQEVDCLIGMNVLSIVSLKQR